MTYHNHKKRKLLSALLGLLFLVGTQLPASAQAPLSQTPDASLKPDCSQYFQIPMDAPEGSEGETPHLMPPHPDLQECIDRGEVQAPPILADSQYKVQAGIDQPQNVAEAAGTFRTLAILVRFSDKNNQVSASKFDSLLFGSGFGTLPDFYNKASYGILDIVTVNLPGTLGWLTMPNFYSYYVGSNQGTGTFPNNAQKLAADAARAADPLVNFANYDNNNDGKVDTILIVHAGKGAEFTGSSSDIWSHSWVTSQYDRPTLDGKQIYSYTIEPEYWSVPNDMTVGVFAHELGHVLGLPDLYDTDYGSRGVGRWSLMAAGSWNGPGNLGGSPAFPDAWSRTQLGWVVPTAIETHTFGQAIPEVAANPFILKLKPTTGRPNEYFLLENRQRASYDAYLPGAGLLVWHIDDNVSTDNNRECLSLNRWTCLSQHYKVALEQADGLLNLEKNINYGDSGDAFPGSANRRSYTFSTSPNNSSYFSSGNPLREIFNISNSQSIMSADFYIGPYDHSFSKGSPLNSGTQPPTGQVLAWDSSLGADSYEYCLDTTPGTTCSTSWINTGINQSVSLANLDSGVTYYWQVRSSNAHGTVEANNGAWWSFSTLSQQPGSFSYFLPYINR